MQGNNQQTPNSIPKDFTWRMVQPIRLFYFQPATNLISWESFNPVNPDSDSYIFKKSARKNRRTSLCLIKGYKEE